MKPIIKICIALSMILFLLGIAGVGVGMAMGITPSELLYMGHYPGRFSLRDSLTEPRIELLEDSLDQISEALPAPPDELGSLAGDNPTEAEEYYEFRDIDSLDIELGLCELCIFRHEEDYIAVTADNTKSYFKCSQKGSSLILRDNRPTSTISNSMEDALVLDLFLPEQEYKEISMEIGAGNVTLIALSAKDVEIENGAGNISLGTLSCRELDVDAGVGELTADSIQVSDKADIEIGTGTATISSFDGKTLNLDCGIGNAEVTAVGKETDYNYQLEAAMGSLYLNHHQQEYDGHHHGSHHEDGPCLDIQNGANRKISILCALGNAELNFTEE